MIDELLTNLTDKEFLEREIASTSLKKLSVIKNPNVFELRDYFINIHFVDNKQYEADDEIVISTTMRPYVVDLIIKILDYNCANGLSIKSSSPMMKTSNTVKVYMTEKSGYEIITNVKKQSGGPEVVITLFSDDREAYLDNIYDRPTLNLVSKDEDAVAMFREAYSQTNDDTKCYWILKGLNAND